MQRRDFITGLATVVTAWPFSASSQQATLPVIGWLNTGPSADPQNASFARAFQVALKDGGYVDGQNIQIEFRWGEGQYARLPGLATELVARGVAVIVAGGPPAAVAAKAATQTIPIVFTSGADPVESGLVASLGRPGGNATGVSVVADEINAKQFSLLRDVVPNASTIAALLNPKAVNFAAQTNDLQEAARARGLQLVLLNAATEQQIDETFATLAQSHASTLLIGGDPYFTSARKQIVAHAASQAVPTMFNSRISVADGGLMAYGPSFVDAYRLAGEYTSRILKGEKPAEMPVIRPTKFELVINLRTAKQLGLTLTPGLIAIADEVIE
jgi:putative tryptophan/tyrosine transport system substrate-binding protein